ncbi:MAG: hypothetical protein KDE53_34430, partial [Caldilineaceae bacterium]|nr:hypothetical protein [Caldilineaceae bacterium]
NDGDGVPDGVDGSPFSAQAVTNSAFGLALSGYQSGKSLDVTFQIRPSDDRHLWWTNTYLDWPDNDKAGQVQRVTDESITSGVDADMQLSPVLEIALPYNGDNPSRGLPVLDGVDAASIGKTTPTTEWLDRTAMAPYAITVGEVNADDGALFAYLPLTTLEDSVGDSPVALTGVMHYEMANAASDWGDDQQVKLLWLVNGLNDDCTVPDGLSDDEAKTYCDDDANWISEQTLLTSYYDDFMVTSLSVKESHGGSAAVFAEQSVGGAYEANLWHLADVLQHTFLTRAADPNTKQRLTVGNIDSHLSPWGVGSLYVNEILDVADDVTLQAALTGAEITAMLDSARSSPSVDERAHLLFAVENSARSVSLGETGSSFGNSTFTLDLSDSAVATRGKLRWQPYIYTAGGWTPATVASANESDTVLDALDTELDSVFSDSVLAALLGETVSDYSSVRAGAKQLAVNTYLSHYAGTSVSIGAASYAGGALFSDSDYTKPSVPAAATVARLLAVIQRYYAHISLSNLDIATSDAEINAVGNTIWADLATSTGAVLTGIGDTATGDASSLAVAVQELDAWADPSDVAGLTDSNTVANTSTITRLSKIGSDAKSFAGRTKTLKGTWEQGRKLQQAMNDVKELRNAQEINLVAGAGKTELQAAQEIVDELAPKFAHKF